MNLSQMGWVLLIISSIYTANDKAQFGFIFSVLAVILFTANIFID